MKHIYINIWEQLAEITGRNKSLTRRSTKSFCRGNSLVADAYFLHNPKAPKDPIDNIIIVTSKNMDKVFGMHPMGHCSGQPLQ